jgi:UDP-glucose 4-epimerase
MTGARIAVLGAGGVIGAAVAARLALDGVVLRVGRRPASDVVADLATPDETLLRALSGCDAAVHCAGVTDEEFASDRASAWRRATEATSRLADLMRSAGVRRVVYVSTAHVYGPLRGPVSERSAPDPRSDYAVAHFAAEQILRRAGFAGGAVRPCAVFGDPPDLDRFRRWSLVPFAFPRMAVDRSEIALATAGMQRRNFVSADGVAECVAALLAPDSGWRTLNAVGAVSLSIRAWAELVAARAARVTGQPCRIAAPDQDPLLREAPLAYLSERGEVGDETLLPAWTDSFLRRLLDARNHATEQRRASA